MNESRRCQIERIGQFHPAHLNNPSEYPVGWWYITDDPDEVHAAWNEAATETWAEALDRAQEMQSRRSTP